MAVYPRQGDALLFWDMHPNGTDVDRASLHASCPTIKVRRMCIPPPSVPDTHTASTVR